MARGIQVTFDAHDPAAVGKFWGEVLGYVEQPPPDGHATWQSFLASIGVPEEEWDTAYAVVDPDGAGPRLYFQKVPEEKSVKNRVHLDVDVTGGRSTPIETRRERVDAAATAAAALGGRKLRSVEEDGGYFTVMADPEGNEFCLH